MSETPERFSDLEQIVVSPFCIWERGRCSVKCRQGWAVCGPVVEDEDGTHQQIRCVTCPAWGERCEAPK